MTAPHRAALRALIVGDGETRIDSYDAADRILAARAATLEVIDRKPEAAKAMRDAIAEIDRLRAALAAAAWAVGKYGPVTTAEAVAADMRSGEFPKRMFTATDTGEGA